MRFDFTSDHPERFITLRARSTSRATSQDIGATLEYHGQRVSFEWQSMQALRIMDSTCGGNRTFEAKDFAAEDWGAMRAWTGTNCIAANTIPI